MSNKWENAFNSDSESVEDERETVNEKDYYLILGVSKSSTQQDIKRSYREKARKLHPDKNPDSTEKYKVLFQELCEAYSILSDPKKRQLYDKHGTAGIKNQNFLIPQTKQDLERLFRMAFDEDETENNVNDDKNVKVEKPQCAPLYCDAKLPPLLPIYNEWKVILPVSRRVVCTVCKIFDPEIHKPCWKCAGKGTYESRDIIPSIIKTQTINCPECDSKGHILTQKNKFIICPKCGGDKTINTRKFELHTRMVTCKLCGGRQFYCSSCHNREYKFETKNLEFVVPPDVKDNEKRIFYGCGNEQKDHQNGDVIVTLKRVGLHTRFTNEKTDTDTPNCKQM